MSDICTFVHRFLGKYVVDLLKQPGFTMDELIGQVLREVCIAGKTSGARLVGFSPADFSMLSDATYDWIAKLLTCIEERAQWPNTVSSRFPLEGFYQA